jgi:hypothetical protein
MRQHAPHPTHLVVSARQRRSGDPIDQPVVTHLGETDHRGSTRQHRTGLGVVGQLLGEPTSDLLDHIEVTVSTNLEVK